MKKIISILTLALVFTACGEKKRVEQEKKEIVKEVKVEKLNYQKIKNIEIYNGDIKPHQEIEIITGTGGYVKEIFYKNGENVKVGDLILTLTDSLTEGNYIEAEGNLIKTKSNYNKIKITYNKYKKLYEKKLISEEKFLESENNLQQGLGDLKIAEGRFLRAKDDYDRLFVKAKISGVITDLDLKKEEKLNPNTKLLTLINNQEMEIKISINGEHIKNFSKHKKAKIYIPDLNETYEGYLNNINLSANKDTKKYVVKINIPNENKGILKGMYGKVELEQGEIEGLFIPKNSVMIKDLYSYVAIARDGKAFIYKVDSGMSQGNLQEIKFKDFKEGDKVVVQGQYLLNNNDKIKEI